MLVLFKVKNFMSFKDEIVLDMRAIKSYKEHPSNLIDVGTDKLIRTLSIYGANASGKSNLIKAIDCFKTLVTRSSYREDISQKSTISKSYFPFAFQKKNAENSKNTEFEITLILGQFEYRYGFSYNDIGISMEWFYQKNLNTNRQSIIFERAQNEIRFGYKYAKEGDLYGKQVSRESLVLSFFGGLVLKSNVYAEVYSYINGIFSFEERIYSNKEVVIDLLKQVIDIVEDKKRLLEFLNYIDTGIKDIELDENNQFITIHHGEDGKDYELSLLSESEGTLRSISIYTFCNWIIARSGLMCLDELNSKLHPLVQKYIIDMFYDKKHNAQLIYTTHDSFMMDKKFFRRDQIAFVEKDEWGHSDLVALSEYKVRSDASFSKDYLAGVYGAIPTFSDFYVREGE